MRNLFSCLHFDISSDFLFRRFSCCGHVMIAIFSVRQRRHLFVVLVYVGAVLRIDQDMLGVVLVSSFVSHMNFDKVVQCLYLRWLNVIL